MTESKTLCAVLAEIGGSSSLHGIPKIASAKHVAVRILWVLLLTGSLALFVYQTVGLFGDYFSYNTRISVTSHAGPVQFPSVTICNINPVRLSKISNLNDSTLGTIYNLAEDIFSKLDPNATVADILSNTNTLINNLGLSLHRRDTTAENETFSALRMKFFDELNKLGDKQRMKMDHQLEDMVISGSFNGNSIALSGFTVMFSKMLGNCFTLDTQNMYSLNGGASNSINLLLNVESSEYLTAFIPTFGIRLMIHEQGSIPIPEDNSITLGTNFETDIKLRMTAIKRLGGRYGDCNDGELFLQQYGIIYTTTACFSICETNQILNKCDCFSGSFSLAIQVNASLCDYLSRDTQICIQEVKESIQKDNLVCDCNPPCKQKVFSTKISGGLWPHRIYVQNVLLPESCRRNLSLSDGLCVEPNISLPLSFEQVSTISRNFLSVNIQFDDVTYDVITEEPSYDTLQFLSDVGGAMGFYTGASVLTYLELVQVAVEIFLFCRSRRACVKPAEQNSPMIQLN